MNQCALKRSRSGPWSVLVALALLTLVGGAGYAEEPHATSGVNLGGSTDQITIWRTSFMFKDDNGVGYFSNGKQNDTVSLEDVFNQNTFEPELPAVAPQPNGEYFFVYQDDVYFSATEPGLGDFELWRAKAPFGELDLVFEINAFGPSNPANFVEFHGELYFTATDIFSGTEIWKYNGTSTTRVTEIAAASASSFPAELTVVDNYLFFSAKSDGNIGRELWRLDTSDTTTLFDINDKLGEDSNPKHLTKFRKAFGSGGEEVLIFDARIQGDPFQTNPGREVFILDNPAGNVNSVSWIDIEDDVIPFSNPLLTGDGRPSTLATGFSILDDPATPNHDDFVFFEATDGFNGGNGTGLELYALDKSANFIGDLQNPTPLKDLNSNPIPNSNGGPHAFFALDDMMFFSADTGNGHRMFKIQIPSPNVGTLSASDVNEFTESANDLFVEGVEMNDELFGIAEVGGSPTNRELFKVSVDIGGIVSYAALSSTDIFDNSTGQPRALFADQGLLFMLGSVKNDVKSGTNPVRLRTVDVDLNQPKFTLLRDDGDPMAHFLSDGNLALLQAVHINERQDLLDTSAKRTTTFQNNQGQIVGLAKRFGRLKLLGEFTKKQTVSNDQNGGEVIIKSPAPNATIQFKIDDGGNLELTGRVLRNTLD